MPESRVIRNGILDSERFNSLSGFAQNFFFRLLLIVDDYGRFDARPAFLRSRLYPVSDYVKEGDIERALHECNNAGVITIYKDFGTGKTYLEVKNFNQRIQAKRSKYPSPEHLTVIHGDEAESTVNHRETPNYDEQQRRDTETHGEEKQKTEVHRDSPCDTVNRSLVGVEDVVEDESQKNKVKLMPQQSDSPPLQSLTPSPEQVQAAMSAVNAGNLQGDELAECARRFVDDAEARGWCDNRGVPLRDWRAAARNYARRYAENNARRAMSNNYKPKHQTDCNNADDYR